MYSSWRSACISGCFAVLNFSSSMEHPPAHAGSEGFAGFRYAGRQRQFAFQQIDAHADVEGEHVAHGFGAASGEEFAEDGDGFVTAGHGKVFGVHAGMP